MRVAVLLVLLGLAPAAALAGTPSPSGPLKAYKGPEGQVVVMILVNDDKQILVHFRGLGGELEARTMLYSVEDLGHGSKNLYETRKRGSKTIRWNVLTERDGDWQFYHPRKPGMIFRLAYSASASSSFKIEDVLNAYKPQEN
jgi:hypothetical protein